MTASPEAPECKERAAGDMVPEFSRSHGLQWSKNGATRRLVQAKCVWFNTATSPAPYAYAPPIDPRCTPFPRACSAPLRLAQIDHRLGNLERSCHQPSNGRGTADPESCKALSND